MIASVATKKVPQKEHGGSSGQVLTKSTRIICYAILIVMAIVVLFPFLWLVNTSLKTQREITFNAWGFTTNPQFINYAAAWKRAHLGTFMRNSIFTAALSVILTIVTCVPMAFVLSRFEFRFKRSLYFIVIFGMMIPINSVIIPLYIMANNLNAMNNLGYLGLVYGAFRVPISVFILEGYMSTIPKELEECAHIDGCSILKMFWHIAAPLSRDTIATVSILAVLSSWNELMVSMLLLSKQTVKTLPIGLMGFISEYQQEYSQLCAGVIIALVPNILFYIFAQEKIQKGMTAGALKG